MIKFAVLGLAALAIALPASADKRGHGHTSKQPAVEIDAKVKGLVDVDADILGKSRKSASILDLDAKIGKLGAAVDLDLSKTKGLNLDVQLGKAGKGGRGGYNNYDFGGGVGN